MMVLEERELTKGAHAPRGTRMGGRRSLGEEVWGLMEGKRLKRMAEKD